MPFRQNMEAADFVKILSRRRWLIVYLFLAVMAGAAIVNLVLPREYKSSATILISPPGISDSVVEKDDKVPLDERLASIQRQILSRTMLMQIMDEVGLYREERKTAPKEALVGQMSGSIVIEIASDVEAKKKGKAKLPWRQGPQNEAITLSFLHKDPQMAMMTAARLASVFIDESIRSKERQSIGTSEFLDTQLKEIKEKLETQESRVKQYKERFMGELPSQIQTNVGRIGRLQEQLRSNAELLRKAEDNKVQYESQIRLLEKPVVTVTEGGKVVEVPAGDPAEPLMTELATKQAQLSDLRAKYTEAYPDVVRMKLEVEQLERRIADVRAKGKGPGGAPVVAAPTGTPHRQGQGNRPAPAPPATPQRPAQGTASREKDDLNKARASLAASEAEIESLKAARKDIEKAIEEWQRRLDQAPRHEQELTSLTRDYEKLKERYGELLAKKVDADISLNLNRREIGEQFQLIDPPNLPMKPDSPDPLRIFGIGAVAALFLAFGASIGVEILDPVIYESKDYRGLFAVPVLASLPVVRDEPAERRRVRTQTALRGGIALLIAVAILALALFATKIHTFIA